MLTIHQFHDLQKPIAVQEQAKTNITNMQKNIYGTYIVPGFLITLTMHDIMKLPTRQLGSGEFYFRLT